MTTCNEETAIAERRQIGGKVMAAISPLPPPQEILADWLMSVPTGVSLDLAARRQIELIDSKGLCHPDVQVLRSLLVVFACSDDWPRPVLNL